MNEVLALSLMTAMAAISGDYCIQAILVDKESSYYLENDMFTFVVSVITSLLATGAVLLLLMRESNKSFGKISLLVTVGLSVLWVGATINYILRKYSTESEASVFY